MEYKEVEGDLIKMAKEGHFDVMGAGIALQMAREYKCNQYSLEHESYRGDITKLGRINFKTFQASKEDGKKKNYHVVNAYTQYDLAKPGETALDYNALAVCLRKINHLFKGRHLGLPQIGCGLAGGDWEGVVLPMIKELFEDSNIDVTIFIL